MRDAAVKDPWHPLKNKSNPAHEETFAEFIALNGIAARANPALSSPDGMPEVSAPPQPETPAIALDAAQWNARLGFQTPVTMDVPRVNAVAGALEQHGFDGHVVDQLLRFDAGLDDATAYSAEDGGARLEREHGPAGAKRLIANAQYMVDRLVRHPLGAKYVAHWEETGALNDPALVRLLGDVMYNNLPKNNRRWTALHLAQTEHETARREQRRAESDRERAQADAERRAWGGRG